VKNLKCERSRCHRRNARLLLYRAVLSLDLKVAMLTVISDCPYSYVLHWNTRITYVLVLYLLIEYAQSSTT